jgi:hypothetical protein
MRLRFYIDPETGEPHLYKHRVSEVEVEQISATLARIGQAAMGPGSRSGALYLAGFCA